MPINLLQDISQDRWVAADPAKLAQYGALQCRGRDAPRLALGPASLVRLHAYVVAVCPIPLLGVGMDHANVAGGATHQAFEQRAVFVPDIASAPPPIAAERSLDLAPNLVIDDAIVLAFVHLAAVVHLADV